MDNKQASTDMVCQVAVVQEMWKTESVSNGAWLGRFMEALSVEWLGGKPDRNASIQERMERVGCETPQRQPLTKVVR